MLMLHKRYGNSLVNIVWAASFTKAAVFGKLERSRYGRLCGLLVTVYRDTFVGWGSSRNSMMVSTISSLAPLLTLKKSQKNLSSSLVCLARASFLLVRSSGV